MLWGPFVVQSGSWRETRDCWAGEGDEVEMCREAAVGTETGRVAAWGEEAHGAGTGCWLERPEGRAL